MTLLDSINSPEDLKKLFRIDVSYSTLGTAKEKGTGLGLILCKELVQRMDGEISVRSKLGEVENPGDLRPIFEELEKVVNEAKENSEGLSAVALNKIAGMIKFEVDDKGHNEKRKSCINSLEDKDNLNNAHSRFSFSVRFGYLFSKFL